MSRIPLHTKVSLINNYIQSNYLKSRGKAEHEDWLISKILESIIEDLNALENERSKTQEELPINLMVRDLKFIQEKQNNLKGALVSLTEELNRLKAEQTDPSVNLKDIIKQLEEFGKQ